MYRWLVRALAAVTLLFSCWPVLRIADFAIFDLLAPLTIGASLLCKRAEGSAAASGSLKFPFIGIGLLVLGGYLALTGSTDTEEHLKKLAVLVVALSAMATLAWVLAEKGVFTLTETLLLLCLSGTVSSGVAILQGRLGMFLNLLPDKAEPWSRMAGLTQHPLEAGSVAAFAAIIALGMAIYEKRRRLPLLLSFAVNLLSLQYSASLTAVFALLAAIVAVALFYRAYLSLVLLASCAILLGGSLAITNSLPAQLATRLQTVMSVGGNYTTVQLRERQWRETLEQIDGSTIFLGNGYSSADLPDGKEIHNGFLASLFHFGILGLASQVVIIGYFMTRLLTDASRSLRAIVFGCMVVFILEYDSAPALARRTVWVPMFLIGAYVGRTVSPRALRPVGPLAPVQPHA
jgi:O-antigen ligase